MKVSQWFLEYEISGQMPEAEDPLVGFWAGWLIGRARGSTDAIRTMAEAISFARKAAEFIEKAE